MFGFCISFDTLTFLTGSVLFGGHAEDAQLVCLLSSAEIYMSPDGKADLESSGLDQSPCVYCVPSADGNGV
jgi:hypothetical protein